MSYLVLARKFRPKTFQELVGQKAVVRTLQNALTQNRVSHALIFSGVRGVGKTTLARIMAKALNCEQEHAPEPCNACTSCSEINAGNSVDLIEIDGASNRGIQEIRELKENIRFMPTGSRYKIIIIDEVHMLTTEAFNALLKTLEEPPEHVYFMFATTELHRVPITILSRCQRYELQRVGSRELKAYFQTIADHEKVSIEPAALNIIVREAGGSVRDGLSLLDQIFSYCGDAVRMKDIVDILGLAGHQAVAELSAALLDGDIGGALEKLDRTCAFGVDFKRFINDLLSWFRSLVVCGISRHPEQLLDLPEEELNELLQCAGKYTPQTLILMFNALLENLEKAGYSSQPRFALEMALIKAVQAREVIPVTSILGRLDEILRNETACSMPEGVEPEGEKKKTSDPGPSGNGSQYTADSGGDPETETSDAENTGHVYTDDGDEETSYPEFQKEGLADDSSSAGNQQGNDPAVQVHDSRIVRQQWSDFIQYVQDRKPWMASALQMAKSAYLLEGELVIEYENSFNCRMLKNRENITLLTEFALDFFQGDFRIRFSVPDSAACDVDPTNGVRVQHDRQALANDSLVLTAVDIFNGEVGDIRVGPRFRGPLGEMQETENSSPPDDC